MHASAVRSCLAELLRFLRHYALANGTLLDHILKVLRSIASGVASALHVANISISLVLQLRGFRAYHGTLTGVHRSRRLTVAAL